MKKYYFFAALATVGLFASCSSDEDFNEAEGARLMSVVDDSQAAPITIGVMASGTRGTGTVGDITGQAANTWAGQKFNLFMYEKGTFTPAQYIPSQGANPEDIFNNAEMTAPKNAGSGEATYYVDLSGTPTAQYNYYPATGSYSFWAYRVDDAGTGTNHVGVPAMYEGDGTTVTTTEADAMTVKVPFVIDGSQDLMIGVADTAAAATALNTADDKIATDEAAAEKIYSAYAARRGVNPTLTFQHLLTRLTFQVKAAAKDVSTAAVAPVPAIPGWKAGFEVTGIVVRSKSEGNIIAAWKGNPEDYDTKSERIEWTKASEDWSAPATLAPLSLKSRQLAVTTKADYVMVSVYGDATATVTIPAGYRDAKGNTGTMDPTTLTAAEKGGTYVVYDSEDISTVTGLPTGNKTSMTAAGHTLVYIPCYKAGYDAPVYSTAADANQPLVTLVSVVPGWNGTDDQPAADAVYTTNDLYTVTGTETPAADDAAVDAAAETAAAGTLYFNVNNGAKYVKVVVTTGATTPGTTTDAVYTKTEYEAAETVADATALANAAKALTATGHKVYYQTDATKFVDVNVTAGATAFVAGTPNTVKTSIGEALLVAPADEHGYRVEVTYTRTKKINSTTVQPLSDTAVIDVVRNANVSGAKTPVAFEPGKSYNVVITLYSDGETKSDTDLQGWEDGDGLDDSYDAE